MIYLSKSYLVYAQIDPIGCAEIKSITTQNLTPVQLITISSQIFDYDHNFAQVGTSTRLIQEIVDDGTPTPIYDTFNILYIKYHTFEVVAYGYDITDDDRTQLEVMFLPGCDFIIPSQVVEIVPFTQKPSVNGLNCSMNYDLFNAIDFIPLFNRISLDLTVYKNPMLKDLQFTNGFHKISDISCATFGPWFYAMTLSNSDLDNVFELNEKYEDSLSRLLNTDNGTYLYNTLRNQTAFIPPFLIEHQSDDFFFNGLETGDFEITIKLRATPIWNGSGDTYYHPDPLDLNIINLTPPDLVICYDIWFNFKTETGFEYHDMGTPNKYNNPDSRIWMNSGTTQYNFLKVK
jgi:hypothetical protein